MKCGKDNAYDVTRGDFVEDAFNEVNCREQIIEKKNNLNSFSFKCYHYHKTKRLVQKIHPSIVREIETRQKK